MTAKSTLSRPTQSILGQWRDYFELCKPKVVALMVFTAIVGMLLADPANVNVLTLVFATLGIALVASAAAAINHVADSRIDAAMDRTKLRPLPSGSLDCLLYTSPSPRDLSTSRMPSSA